MGLMGIMRLLAIGAESFALCGKLTLDDLSGLGCQHRTKRPLVSGRSSRWCLSAEREQSRNHAWSPDHTHPRTSGRDGRVSSTVSGCARCWVTDSLCRMAPMSHTFAVIDRTAEMSNGEWAFESTSIRTAARPHPASTPPPRIHHFPLPTVMSWRRGARGNELV